MIKIDSIEAWYESNFLKLMKKILYKQKQTNTIERVITMAFRKGECKKKYKTIEKKRYSSKVKI